LATIAQRIIAGEKKTEGQEGYLSAEEKAQLLAEIDSIQQEVSKVDDLQFEIDEIKDKIN